MTKRSKVQAMYLGVEEGAWLVACVHRFFFLLFVCRISVYLECSGDIKSVCVCVCVRVCICPGPGPGGGTLASQGEGEKKEKEGRPINNH